ncbi:unnamed protein product [Closterium sp. Yama58-4]|nr:unnamed protein product [Closterium sp. Yama58-4]
MGQLQRFDGRSPDPKVWLSQATRAMRCFLANTMDEQKLDCLLIHLTDSAYVWAESKNFTTVSGFEQAFQSRFVWESTATVMHKLAKLKQKKGQTVTELADEVRQLAAYVKDYLVAMMVRAFIEGLEGPGLRDKVLGGRPVSLEAAEEAAKYFVTYAQPKEIEEKKWSGETSKPWEILPDVPVRVGKLTLPVDIAVTGANTYDMLLGQDLIYSANADILTSKGKIVYQGNTTDDSVPITTGPLGGATRPSFVLFPSHTVHRNIKEEDEGWIKEWMEERDFLNWMEERRVAMAEEEGRMELTAEEEDEYYLWLREQEEEEEKEEVSSEEFEEEEGEKEIKEARGEEEETWGHDFGSPTADEMGAWDTMGTGIDWDKEYEEMVEKYVEEVNEAKLEGDSMVDGEEYLDQGTEDWELVYDKKRKRISPDHLFELFNYPAAERWNYLAAEKGDEGRIILGSYYTLKKEAPRVACPAFEDLPVSLNHELGEQQQKEVRTLLVEEKNEEGESSESVTQGEKENGGEEEESSEEKDGEDDSKGEEEEGSEEEEEGEADGSQEKEEGSKDKDGEVEEDSSEEEEGEEVGEEEDSGDFEEGQRPEDEVDEQLLEELGQPKKKARVDGDEEEGEEGTPSKNLASETTLDIWDDANTLFFLEKGAVDPAWNSVEKRRRTTDLVKKQYDWYGLGSDVTAFVKGCATCVFQKGSWTAKGELQPVPVTKPWERVVIDFIGPLHTTAKGGNKYVISAMDHFTKWPECKPEQQADAATAAAFVAEKIISNHGCPLVIHMENGTHFKGEFGVLLEKFGIYHKFSRPEHPQSSGLIERFQRTLKGALLRLGEANPLEWDENIWWYGRHPNITGSTMADFEVRELSELSTEEEADAVAGYLYKRTSDLELALALAAGNHDRAQEKQKMDFDLRRTTVLEKEKLEKGDFIRIRPSKRVAWENQKPKFKTLFKVKEVEQFHVVLVWSSMEGVSRERAAGEVSALEPHPHSPREV